MHLEAERFQDGYSDQHRHKLFLFHALQFIQLDSEFGP